MQSALFQSHEDQPSVKPNWPDLSAALSDYNDLGEVLSKDLAVSFVFSLHGIPADIVSDWGPQFTPSLEGVLSVDGSFGQSRLVLTPNQWTNGKS